MGKKIINTCPVTGEPVTDRVYNKSAIYSKRGYEIMREEYLREYNRVYYSAQKTVGIGMLILICEEPK